MLDSSLGAEGAVLTEVRGTEAISAPFLFEIEFATIKSTGDVRKLLGNAVTLWLSNQDEADRRPVHGLVRRLAGPSAGPRGFRLWRAEVAPKLAFLGYSADCRIFQHKTIPDILKEVFDDHDVSVDMKGVTGTYKKLDYCVQYRETALNFVSRLMEHVGIFYWHEHSKESHKLVLADTNVVTPAAIDGTATLPGRTEFADIGRLMNDYACLTGKWAATDYDFVAPGSSLHADAPTMIHEGAPAKYEVFDYPGLYYDRSEGSDLTQVRMEAEEVKFHRLNGESGRARFAAGFTVKIGTEAAEALNVSDKLLLTEVRHDASDRSHVAAEAAPPAYGNSFVAIPIRVPFRPQRQAEKPYVRGIQTAIVTGPPGEEIHVDKYGRVKVRFFWDRNPAGNSEEHRSCWLRVSHAWAGSGFGTVHLPRVGHEVIVDFLEGDPDRPIITGRVYNGANPHPLDLPAQKAISGIVTETVRTGVGASNSSGGNASLITVNDKTGDVTANTANNKTETVEHDLNQIIKKFEKKEAETFSQKANKAFTQYKHWDAKHDVQVQTSVEIYIMSALSIQTVTPTNIAIVPVHNLGVVGTDVSMGLKSVEKFPEHSEDKELKTEDVATEIGKRGVTKKDTDTKIEKTGTDIKKSKDTIDNSQNLVIGTSKMLVSSK